MRAPLLVLAVLLAPGCLGEEEPDVLPCASPCPSPDEGPAGCEGCPTPNATGPGARPDLPVGRAWTYVAEEIYSSDPEWTLVVAKKTAEGYLLAGATEDDVVYPLMWGSAFFGAFDLDLTRPDHVRLFDFPITDGKTWELLEAWPVTARAADVRTPNGIEPGFVIEGERETFPIRARYSYAASVGFVVDYELHWEDVLLDRVTLRSVRQGSPWVWGALGPIAQTGGAPVVLHATEPGDAFLVSAGGAGGTSRVFVEPPGGAPVTFEFGEEEVWTNAILPAAAGHWTAGVGARPWLGQPLPANPPALGWAWVRMAPVTWERGEA